MLHVYPRPWPRGPSYIRVGAELTLRARRAARGKPASGELLGAARCPSRPQLSPDLGGRTEGPGSAHRLRYD